MENITTLLNTTVISVKSVAYTIRHYDRIDTFCDSKELGSEFSHFLICGLLQSVIHFMGTFTNFFSILVLRKPDSHSAFYVFLLALFSCDTLILVLNGIFFILPQLLKYVGTLPTFSYIVAPIAAQYAYPLVNMGYTAGTYFTAIIILERYVVICRPLRHRHLCSLSRSYKITLGVILGSILVNIPRFWDYKALLTLNRDGEEIYEITPMSFMRIRMYRKYYLFVTWFMTRFVIPVGIMVYSSLLTTVAILKSYIRRKMLSTVKRHEHNLAKIGITVVAIYLICNFPTCYSRLARGFAKTKPRPNIIYVSNVLLALNSSLKWAILCMFKSRFRVHFFQLVTLPCSCLIEMKSWIHPRHDAEKIIHDSTAVLQNGENEDAACRTSV